MEVIRELPIGASEQRSLDEANGSGGTAFEEAGKVLADGTYAMETAPTSTNEKKDAVKIASSKYSTYFLYSLFKTRAILRSSYRCQSFPPTPPVQLVILYICWSLP